MAANEIGFREVLSINLAVILYEKTEVLHIKKIKKAVKYFIIDGFH